MASLAPRPRNIQRLWISIVLAGLLFASPWTVKLIDRVWFHEALKDFYADVRHGEDWSSATSLGNLDYTWLESSAEPIRIAHALGGAGGPDANRLQMGVRSVANGFRLLEVDLWLDQTSGVVHCHHGPEPPNHQTDCRIEQLADLIAKTGAWLVLDIKTPFAPSLAAILRPLADRGVVQQAIVQLYAPDDFGIYEAARRTHHLVGPIVATHNAHRSIEHVAQQAAVRGVRAISVPLGRLPALRPIQTVKVLAHPVRDCAALSRSVALGANGAFLISGLDCRAVPATGTL